MGHGRCWVQSSEARGKGHGVGGQRLGLEVPLSTCFRAPLSQAFSLDPVFLSCAWARWREVCRFGWGYETTL